MPKPRSLDRNVLGGKGAGLVDMTSMGLPVPPGFTLTTEVCAHWVETGSLPEGTRTEVEKAMVRMGKAMGRHFAGAGEPLLVSVRSGARVSMPGMMDTVLNLGLSPEKVEALAEATGNPRFAWDSYRRFVSMFGDVVLGLCSADHNPFESILEREKKKAGVVLDHQLSAAALKRVAIASRNWVKKKTGKAFPDDPWDQLWASIAAVFDSWNNARAAAYRRLNGIPDGWGTAVNIQAMVFGNLGQDSGTGVGFTRNPATGEKGMYGEYLMDAQGEDVVAGTRTPHPLEEMKADHPASYRELARVSKTLEDEFRDMQDFEFTIERGRLFMLQTRVGKRTGTAAVRIATDMVKEGRIKPNEALLRIDPEGLVQLLGPVFQGSDQGKSAAEVLARGLPAGPGAASGRIVFKAEDAVEEARKGPVILVREETSPEDILGMAASEGILTSRGGMTSHAALVARQMGKVCVAGCGEAEVDVARGTLRAGGRTLFKGDWLSLDGTSGEVLFGRLPTQDSEVVQVVTGRRKPSRSGDDARFRQVMGWADKARRLKVRANADLPEQATTAIAFGAEGIGLCRTEHMFFGEKELPAVQRMILADDPEARRKALMKILPLQRRDFTGLFKAMGSRPVTIRTLDPPLHEFLPTTEKGVRALAKSLDLPPAPLRRRIASLHETNPMLGFRGCRLTYLFPEILDVQARAILEAAIAVRKTGIRVQPEIMIPLVGHLGELSPHVERIHQIAADIKKKTGKRVSYQVGTMIEIPRAALTAGRVAEAAEFFSFGTNDLTQTTLGVSRDDSGSFLPRYVEEGIYPADPFSSLDQEGVGRLLTWSVEEGRKARPGLKVGVCGEHGGDPASIDFFHRAGLDYVSCSPFRIPVARLAAAQAALLHG